MLLVVSSIGFDSGEAFTKTQKSLVWTKRLNVIILGIDYISLQRGELIMC
jgi:hypothetical protein